MNLNEYHYEVLEYFYNKSDFIELNEVPISISGLGYQQEFKNCVHHLDLNKLLDKKPVRKATRFIDTFKISDKGAELIISYLRMKHKVPTRKYKYYTRDHKTGEWIFDGIKELDYDFKTTPNKEFKYIPLIDEVKENTASSTIILGHNYGNVLHHSDFRDLDNKPTIQPTTAPMTSPPKKFGGKVLKFVFNNIVAIIVSIIGGIIVGYVLWRMGWLN